MTRPAPAEIRLFAFNAIPERTESLLKFAAAEPTHERQETGGS
jgi:hypothetical protein